MKKLKPFNLEEAKAGKPVFTRDGREVRIKAFDVKGDYPILALILNADDEGIFESALLFSNNGETVIEAALCDTDLMMSVETRELWVNVYRSEIGKPYTSHSSYSNKEDGVSYGKQMPGYITTVLVYSEEV